MVAGSVRKQWSLHKCREVGSHGLQQSGFLQYHFGMLRSSAGNETIRGFEKRRAKAGRCAAGGVMPAKRGRPPILDDDSELMGRGGRRCPWAGLMLAWRYALLFIRPSLGRPLR
jgi:hypothetical protein